MPPGCAPCLFAAATCPQQVLGTPEHLNVSAVSGTCYCWLSPPLAGTTTVPVASEPPGHTVTAPVMSSGMETGRVPAHPHSEEPIMNFTLRLLDGECSGGAAGQCWGVRPWNGSSQDSWAQPAASQCLLLAGPSTRTTRKGGCPCRNSLLLLVEGVGL